MTAVSVRTALRPSDEHLPYSGHAGKPTPSMGGVTTPVRARAPAKSEPAFEPLDEKSENAPEDAERADPVVQHNVRHGQWFFAPQLRRPV